MSERHRTLNELIDLLAELADTNELRPLSMMEMLACVDDRGRVRCPVCGRFTTQDQLSRDNAIHTPGMVLDLLPRCNKCAPP